MYKVKWVILVSLIFGVHISSLAQIVVKGKILSEADNQPIPYANIGLLNTTIGTISNLDGRFSIKIPQKYLEEELLFSAIGYELNAQAVASFTIGKEVVIILNEKVVYLDNVVISATAKREKEQLTWLGNKRRNLLIQGKMNIDSVNAGGAMALLIERNNSLDQKFIREA
jgi:predicted thioesterase